MKPNEDKKKLSLEDLEQVTGGSRIVEVFEEGFDDPNPTDPNGSGSNGTTPTTTAGTSTTPDTGGSVIQDVF